MFKKPPSNIKTSSPLRNSDRKKLKHNAITAFGLTPEEGEALVPVGIQSVKFSTHLDEHGVAYLDHDGTPLWITLGKGSEDLIPTIYTLWKKQDLLPFLSTPSAVVPILVGGADLMIPGVIHCPPSLAEDRLVCIRQYVKKDGVPHLSAPLAVGRLALPTHKLRDAGQEKGKAVLVLHTWKDHLWEIGFKGDPPQDTPLPPLTGDNSADALSRVASDSDDEEEDSDKATTPPRSNAPSPSPHPAAEQPVSSSASAGVSYTPQEVTDLLLKSLVQAISKVLSILPANKFPIPATVLYSAYILPNRPAFPTRVLPPENYSVSPPESTEPESNITPTIATELTIKSSSHKSLTTFLKSVEKLGLVALKPPQKQQPDILIMSVNVSHPLVREHSPFVTVKEVELTAAKKATRQERNGQEGSEIGGSEVGIRELWKPHQETVRLFEIMEARVNDLYTLTQVRDLLEEYITSQNLVNPHEKAYINLDAALATCLTPSSKGKTKSKAGEEETPPVEFLRRDDIVKGVLKRMQGWYEIKAPGKDLVTKKGTISPIKIETKIRQGRKACTLITGFEPFLVVDATDMAEDLRKICAGATSVNPIPGKAAGSGMEVLVQGKQTKAASEYLMAKGIPKKWIVVSDVKGKK
ncbi:eukaryotic translation initiation factor SUI1 family protein [Crepidotus variabilis]|uniref:Eukaryotic translation initiation factor SUI1 family protein n=1 Tax=Crepidotus variabilis TaxID=179855 RepID=A0A9P6EH75_9AGAR|nr:eukaryotic translation initiation factor SUI1 family protein [Crepidotus variabilis]